MPDDSGSITGNEMPEGQDGLQANLHKPTTVYARLSLNYNSDSRELIAVLTPAQEATAFSLEDLQDRVLRGGFESIELFDSALENLLESISKLEYGNYPIGEKPILVAVHFGFNEESKKLEAIVENGEVKVEYSLESLRQDLDDQGFAEFRVTDATIEDLLDAVDKKRFGTFPLADKPVYTTILLELDEESQTVYAVLKESATEVVFNQMMLKALLKDKGFDNCKFEDGAVEQVLKDAKKHKHGKYAIADRLDATIEFTFNSDLTEAYVTTEAAMGGREISVEFLKEKIEAANLDPGCIDKELLKQVCMQKKVKNFMFAQGKKPVNGANATFEPLVQEFVFTKPQANETGVVNINNIKEFISVDEGEELMRRTPATLGDDGYTVLGDAITAKPGEDTPFDKKLDGAEVSEDDENLLISTSKGHPVVQARGVRIDKTLTVNNVGTHTGNIDFDGSLLVKGEVMGGLEVKVTGDLIIKDMVHNARLEAGNNITVNHGVVGSCKKEIGETEACEAYIKAGGNIVARYISMAELICDGEVEVKEYIAHCRTTAKGKVMVGQNGGKGILSGGECHSHIAIEAKEIGTDSGVKTLLTTGAPKSDRAHFQQWQEEFAAKKEMAKKMVGLLKKSEQEAASKSDDEDFQRKLRNLKIKIVEDAKAIEELHLNIEKYKKNRKLARQSYVMVNSKTYPNVQIDIDGSLFNIRQESKGGKFVLFGDDIRWENL